MTDKQVLKWSGDDIIRVLYIHRTYEGLCRTSTWREGGIQIPGEGTWMKKIQNLKDTYRNEENAMKKRRKSHGTT